MLPNGSKRRKCYMTVMEGATANWLDHRMYVGISLCSVMIFCTPWIHKYDLKQLSKQCNEAKKMWDRASAPTKTTTDSRNPFQSTFAEPSQASVRSSRKEKANTSAQTAQPSTDFPSTSNNPGLGPDVPAPGSTIGGILALLTALKSAAPHAPSAKAMVRPL